MNRIYRLVFNSALGQMQVASELGSGVKAVGKGSPVRRAPALRQLCLALLLAGCSGTGMAATLPTGGIWSTGSGTITPTGADALTVNQTTAKAIINWASFDISSAGTVNFLVPGSNGVTVNMINAGTPSTIAGQLSSNGQVFLINPAGIMFSSESNVNVGGLVASTMALDGGVTDDIYDFQGSAQAGAQIINQGNLTATNGSISLLGAAVTNGGSIQAAQINLLAGSQVRLQFYEPGTGISVYLGSISNSTATAFGNSAINNTGTLQARAINLQAAVAPGLLPSLINLGGVVTAGSVSGNDGSLVVQAQGGSIVQSGDVNAGTATLSAEGDITQNSGTLSAGALQFAGPLQNVTLGSASNRIGMIGGTVQRNLVLGNNIALGQFAPLIVGGTSTINTGGNAITLTNHNNDFQNTVSVSTTGNASIVDTNALQLGTVSVAGTLDARAGTGISQTGALSVAGVSTFQAGGSIALEHADNTFGGAVSLTSGGHAGIRNKGQLTLAPLAVGSLDATTSGTSLSTGLSFGGGVIRGALSATSTGTIAQTGALTVAGATTLQTSGDIGFDNPGNAFGGTVSLGGNNAYISDAAMLRFGTLNVGSLFARAPQLRLSGPVTTAGYQLYGGDLLLERDTQLTSTAGAVDFGGRVDGAYALGVTGGWSTFAGNIGGATALSSFDTRGVRDLTTIGGNLTTTGNIAFGVTGVRSGNYTVRSTGGSIAVTGVLDAETDARGQLTLAALNGVLLGADAGASRRLQSLALEGDSVSARGIRVTDTLSVTSDGDYAQQGAYQVGGNAVFQSSGNVTLNHSGNQFKGLVSLSGKDVLVRNTGALALKRVDATRFDAAVSEVGAGISQSTALAVSGASSFSADGDITLGNQGNSFGGRVNLGGNALTLAAGSDLDVNVVRHGPNAAVSLTSAGQLQLQPGNIDTGSADLTLSSGNGVLSTSGALSGRNVSLSGGDGVALGHNINATGTLGLGSRNGAIVQSAGNLLVGGATTVDAGSGAITLQSAGNDFVGAVGLSGGNVAINDANALTLGHATATTFRASSTGDLHLGGVIKANVIDLAAGGLFINALGAAALDVSGGSQQWRIFLDRPDAAHQFNGLDSGNTALWNTTAFAPATAAGNRYLFAYQPTVTFIGNTLRKTYGETVRLDAAYTISGLIGAVAGAYKADNISSATNGAPLISSAGAAVNANASTTGYAVSVNRGTLNTAQSGYALNFVDGTLHVDQRGLTITANNGGKTYGQSGGLAGHGVSGLVNGDSVSSVDLASAGTVATANVGAYTITASNADGTGLSNYDITYTDGVLSIGKAGLTITAGNVNKTYGQNGGLGGYSVDGLLNSDTVSSVALGSNGSAATTNVGNYTITASNADGTGLSNYDITYVDGVLSIGKAGLTITAGNGGKTYGQSGGLGGYNVDGLLNNDAVSKVDLASSGTAATANVGDYTITASNADGTGLSNYDITYVDGTLSIGKAGLTITAGNGGKTYGQTGGLGGYNVDGLLNNDAVSKVDLASSGTAATANVGDYTITASNADGTGLSNYDITYVDGTLSIGKAGLTITAGNSSKTYGQNGGLGSYNVDGLLNNDAVSKVDLASSGTAAAANVGNYTITASNADGTGLSNYDITYVDGTLSIGKAGLTITANSGSKNIGQPSPLYGYTADGLVNGDAIDDVTLSSSGSDVNARPGAYAIFASDAEGTRLGNYDITYREGSVEVVGIPTGQDAQVAREVAANLNRPAFRTLTASPDAALFQLTDSAIQPALDDCSSRGETSCLTLQPE